MELAAPYSREFLADPYATLAHLRETEPVCRVRVFGPFEAWLVSTYELGHGVSSDARFRMSLPDRPNPFGAPVQDEVSLESSAPEEHQRLRRLMMQGFTARRVERLRSAAQDILDSMLDKLGTQEEAELRSELARPFVVAVMGAVFGVPDGGFGDFQAKLIDLGNELRGGDSAGDPEVMRQKAASIKQVRDRYLRELVERKRAEPGDDVLSGLIAARDEERGLSEDELVMALTTLLLAGVITSTNLVVNGVRTLLDHPEQLAVLRERPETVRSAVEECLRFQSPAISFNRMAAEDLRLGGVHIARGDSVIVSITSANRDEAKFADADSFDITRAPNPHLALGHGVHHCLGASVARLQGQVVLGTLFDRFPDLAAVQEVPRWRSDGIVRGVAELPVHLGSTH